MPECRICLLLQGEDRALPFLEQRGRYSWHIYGRPEPCTALRRGSRLVGDRPATIHQEPSKPLPLDGTKCPRSAAS